jgi:putative inorganic carbon (hco3(-)) transporter
VYFEILGEHGWIGLCMFLTLLAMTWRTGSAVIRAAKKKPELLWASDLAAMIQVSMVGYMSAGAFLGLGYFDYIYHLIAVMVVLRALVVAPARVLAPKGSQDMSAPGSWSFTMAFRRL